MEPRKMEQAKRAEEMLREAACIGDEEAVKTLVKSGVNVNVQHSVNGWTPLHWATKRGHTSVVHYLLSCGADPNLPSVRGETPADLAPNDEIKQLLTGGKCDSSESSSTENSHSSSPLPITPNYLAHPPVAPKVDVSDCVPHSSGEMKLCSDSRLLANSEPELVVKVRTSNPPNQDFIEVEIPLRELTFANLLKMCCSELEVNMQKVVKLRKLPNTILRKDKDVMRLHNFAELEVVLLPDEYLDFSMSNGYASKARTVPEINGFIKTETLLNKSAKSGPPASNLFQKSSICKDGIILY